MPQVPNPGGWLPPADSVQLGRDLVQPFPSDLRTLANVDVLQLLASFDPTLERELGSGAQDWESPSTYAFHRRSLPRVWR
jgi:hypothetical protein